MRSGVTTPDLTSEMSSIAEDISNDYPLIEDVIADNRIPAYNLIVDAVFQTPVIMLPQHSQSNKVRMWLAAAIQGPSRGHTGGI